MSETRERIQWGYNQAISLRPTDEAIIENTNSGSNSLLTMKNESSRNTANVMVSLGDQSQTYKLKPKKEIEFGPKDFEGLTFVVSNYTSESTPADVRIQLVSNN